MRKIPQPVLLVVLILSVVAFANVASDGGASNPPAKHSVNDVYVPPAVCRGRQTGFILLLKLDRSAFERDSKLPESEVPSSDDLTKQSYNSIASQMQPDILKKYRLPLTLN